jgi:thiamine transporter ThiT
MIKGSLYKVILSVLIATTISVEFSGIRYSSGLFSYIVVGIIFGLSILLSERLIRFFTFKQNIITRIISGVILSCICFYLLDLLSPLISFKEGVVKGFSAYVFTFKDIPLDKNTGLVVYGSVCGIINSLLNEFKH